MIISGKWIALNRHDNDFTEIFGESKEGLPVVIWLNIDNIHALTCYEDRTWLKVDDEVLIKLTTEAANKLIEYMRKERDKKVEKFADKMREAKALVGILDEYNKKICKEEQCTEE